ncbi:hypothetical protein PBN151_0331 [Paenibacillus sp. NAIST15-1]|nr:hypothetical protein PBN151_0331 [Paenibacillus sp. NAIST15-1]
MDDTHHAGQLLSYWEVYRFPLRVPWNKMPIDILAHHSDTAVNSSAHTMDGI